MSCEACETIQNLAFNKNIAETVHIAYIRIENANVAVVGCKKHIAETIWRISNCRR